MVSERVTGLVSGLGVEDVLDAVQTWHAAQRDLETRIFTAAAHFADLHHPDSRGADGPVLPGSERGVSLGGAGTPQVWEFAPAEFAARLGRSTYAGRALIADALDVRHRLPKLWARVCAAEVPVFHARHVAQATRDLSRAGAALVDTGVVEYADGRISWRRFENLVAAKVIEADPQAAADRERLAAEEEFVRVGQSNQHGQKTMYVKAPAAKVTRVKATIGFFADALGALGDPGTADQREVDGLLAMANPPQAVRLLQAFANHRAGHADGRADIAADIAAGGEPDQPGQPGLDDPDDEAGDNGDARPSALPDGATSPVARFQKPFRPDEIGPDSRFALGFDPRKLLPSVTVYLHLYARTDTGQVGPVARWEGEAPVTTEYVRDILGPACQLVVKPVIDLNAMAPVDAHEIPDRHREAVHLRTPADVFPYASNTTRTQQIDHTSPYLSPDHGGPPGQTTLENLGPMTRFHHRIKTHGTWQVKQPFPGIYLWRDPHSRTYLVDHTGTRPLGKTEPDRGLPDIAIDITPAPPGTESYYEGAHAS
jgi:Domain of unknown function (DUF222)